MTPKLFGVEVSRSVQAWANRLAKYLDEVRSVLQFKTADSKATQDGVILYDPINQYPVVTVNGEFRQVILSNGYLMAHSTQDQPIATANTPQAVTFNTVDDSNTISVSADSITFEHSGLYYIAISLEFLASSGSTKNIYFYVEKNGVAQTACHESMHQASQAKLCTRSSLLTVAKNDIIKVVMISDSTDVKLNAENATGSIPSIPSATITITRIKA